MGIYCFEIECPAIGLRYKGGRKNLIEEDRPLLIYSRNRQVATRGFITDIIRKVHVDSVQPLFPVSKSVKVTAGVEVGRDGGLLQLKCGEMDESRCSFDQKKKKEMELKFQRTHVTPAVGWER